MIEKFEWVLRGIQEGLGEALRRIWRGITGPEGDLGVVLGRVWGWS